MTLLTLIVIALLAFEFLFALALILLVVRLVTFAHSVSPRLAWGIVGCAILVFAMAEGGVKYLRSKEARTREAATAEVMQARRLAAEQALAAEVQGAQAEREARAALVERWHVARRAAIEEWGKNLVSTGALGDQGVAPPMLDIHDTGSLVSITNRAPGPACVLIERFGINESGARIRCAIGGERCVVIRSGETRRLPTLGGPGKCASRLLEFRVGDVDHPEPGWWSKSAFDAFGSEDPGPKFEPRWSDKFLRAEIGRLDEQMKDRMRVER